ncbi:Aste57867_20872 [Aphanomyces stellatus]|uniref:RING-type E3 ubiquitin transferase n=1 Tax=Aphanomyces stellatus TaxID=120398 RepID=A0A485LI29_9STRA|nr:hypothetical protein As57867_020804 [Aphanomyces stellatus]VFT97549.1 Aste57867_20872 [Aphanomyces stellatus]
MFTLPGKGARRRVPALPFLAPLQRASPGDGMREMLAALEAESRLLQQVLLLRPVSAALVYSPGQAVTINAEEFFRELAQDSCFGTDGERTAWLESHRLVVELVTYLLDCFDRINRQIVSPPMETSLESATEAAGYAMAHTLIQAHVHTLVHDHPPSSSFDAASILVTLVLSSSAVEYGHMHPQHKHPLVPSNGAVVFDATHSGKAAASTTWQCTVCHRTAMAKTDVVYRCGGCDVNLCKECFTRIPHSGATRPHRPPPRRLHGLWTHSLGMLCTANMAAVALEVAHVLRVRVLELPLTAGTNVLAALHVLDEMVAGRPFCAALVRSHAWLPAIISGKSMEVASFLGPFFRHCSLPDDAAPADVMCGPTADASRAKARDTLEAVQSALTSIVRRFLGHGGAVKEAMLCWVACAIEANGVRRRLGHSPVECASDGFLINLAAVALSFVDAVDVTTIDPSHHMASPGRVSFADSARLLPKRPMTTTTMQLPPPPPPPLHEYYPRYDAHLGVVCDHCQEKDFVETRFKCACCDDYDLCAKCYAAGHAALHDPHHLFLRLPIPLPQVTTWSFRKLPAWVGDDDVIQDAHTCDACGRANDDNVMFQCGQCDRRRVCRRCVDMEEDTAGGNPHHLHAPGHHYLVVPVASMPLRRLHQSMYPPQFLPMRQDDDDASSWWYMALKCLHVGPVLTFMRYVSVHREYQQLKALCNMENRTRQQSQGSGGRRSTRSASLNLNANHVRVDELLKTKSAMEVQLFAPSLVRAIFGFYMHVARWLIHLLETPVASWSIEPSSADVAAAYAAAPESILCNMADVLYLVGVHACDGVDWTDLEPLVSLLFYLIARRDLTNSPHVRVQLIRALLSLAPLVSKQPADNKSSPMLYPVLVRNPFLRTYAVDALLAFHTDLDQYSNNTGGDTSWGLLPARLSTLLLLRWLWNAPVVVVDPAADRSDSHGLVLLFSGVLHDITRLLDEANVKVQAMRRLQELQESPSSSSTGAYFQPAMMHSYMALHFNKARTTFRVLIESLELLAWIVSVPTLRAVLCRRSLVDQAASTLSFLVATLETQLHPTRWGFSGEIYQDGMLALAEALIIVVRCAGLHASCPEASSWKLSNYAGILMEEKIGDLDVHQRWKLSSCLFRVEREANASTTTTTTDDVEAEPMDDEAALAFLEAKAARMRRDDDADRRQRQLATRFVAALAADGRFEAVRFRRTAVLLRSDPSLTPAWREKFLQVVEQTEALMALHEQMETRLGDVPDEYLDPILHTLMLHPVQLPSGHIVDRTMIERHLLSARVNPFSREPLTLEMLRPCTDLQAKIERFVRSKLSPSVVGDEADAAAWGLGWDCLFEQATAPN